MMTPTNGNIFSVTAHLCGEFTGQRWIPRTKVSDTKLWCFLWSVLNKRLSKQWWGWWFDMLSLPLWRHSNGLTDIAFDHVFYRPGGLVQTPWDFAGNLVRTQHIANYVFTWRKATHSDNQCCVKSCLKLTNDIYLPICICLWMNLLHFI